MKVSQLLVVLGGLFISAFASVTRDVSTITSDRPIKHFTLNVTEVFDTLNGDENNKRILYAINGAPFNGGKALRVNEGDRVIIDLLNNAYSMNTTLHGHGIPQDGTPWSDGVPGITQSLVEPGQNFTYDFFAENISNAYWLHSHISDLYQDGIALPIYFTPSVDRKRPFSLIPNITKDEVEALTEMDKNPEIMMVSDYSVLNATQQISKSKYWHSELLCYDSILINGRGRINCPSMHLLETYADANPNALISSDIVTAKGCPNINTNAVSENVTLEDDIWFDCNPTNEPLQTFEFDYESGWGVLYMVSAASHWTYIVSIDEHPVYIFSTDGTYHEPAQAEAFSFVIGERLGLAFRLHTPGEYTMRISVLNAPQILGTYAIIRYGLADDDFSIIYTDPINEGEPGLPMIPASVPYINYGGAVTNESIQTFESAQLKSFDAPPVPKAHEKADVTLRFDLGYDGIILWSMTYDNDTTEYYPESRQYEEPPVLFDMEKYINATSTVSYPSGSVVDIIFAVVGTVQPPHPMHKHFSHAHILSYGNGNWTYDNTDITEAEQQGIEINWENPPFTDTFNTPASTATEGSYMVIRYQSTQPATELIHCHIWSHQGMGMSYLLVSEGETEIPEYYKQKSLVSMDSA